MVASAVRHQEFTFSARKTVKKIKIFVQFSKLEIVKIIKQLNILISIEGKKSSYEMRNKNFQDMNDILQLIPILIQVYHSKLATN